MPKNCKCGGKYVPLYHEKNPAYFRCKCNRCGKIVSQKKRQSSKKVENA